MAWNHVLEPEQVLARRLDLNHPASAMSILKLKRMLPSHRNCDEGQTRRKQTVRRELLSRCGVQLMKPVFLNTP